MKVGQEVRIHRAASVHPSAELGAGVTVGPYSVLGENVQIGEGTQVGARVTIEGWTTLGVGNRIFDGAVIGSEPQDLKYKGEKSFVVIGDHNTIREFATVNRGTATGGGTTRIGNDNLLMAYTHVAHDCEVGNRVIMSNCATLGGQVRVEDRVVISGMAGVHHFVTIGRLAILGGSSKVVRDIPPFCMADGHPAKVYGVNLIGLKRAGIPAERIAALRKAFRLLTHSHLNTSQALQRIAEEVEDTPEVAYLTAFLRASARGRLGRAMGAERGQRNAR